MIQVSTRLLQTTAKGQRIALDQVMDEVKQIRHTQAVQARFGQLHQGLGSVTDQVQHPHTQCLKPCLDQRVPGLIGAIIGDLFNHQIAAYQVHEHHYHPLQKRFIYCPNDRSCLAPGNPLTLPSLDRLKDHAFQLLHQASQGARRTAHMPLQMKPSEKLAHRFRPNPALEAKEIEHRDDQADEPTAACFGFPKPRLRVAITARYRLPQTMHAALGESSLNRDLSKACLGVVTKGVENQTAFRPKSHVGRSSAGYLNSWWNSVP